MEEKVPKTLLQHTNQYLGSVEIELQDPNIDMDVNNNLLGGLSPGLDIWQEYRYA